MDIIIPPFKVMVSTRPMFSDFRSVTYAVELPSVELPSFALSEGAAEDAYATFISSNFPDQLKLMKYICYTVPDKDFQEHLTTALCPHVSLNGYLYNVLGLAGRMRRFTDVSLYHTRLAWADHMAKHIAMQLGRRP